MNQNLKNEEGKGAKTAYTVTVGDKKIDLTIEQLLKMATIGLENSMKNTNGEKYFGQKNSVGTGGDNRTNMSTQNAQHSQMPHAKTDDLGYAAFLREFPGVTPESIPREVWANAEKEGSLISAYRAYKILLLNAENKELKRQLQNNKNYIGSASSDGNMPQSDPFLSALMGKKI